MPIFIKSKTSNTFVEVKVDPVKQEIVPTSNVDISQIVITIQKES